jgi:hypothetical protein
MRPIQFLVDWALGLFPQVLVDWALGLFPQVLVDWALGLFPQVLVDWALGLFPQVLVDWALGLFPQVLVDWALGLFPQNSPGWSTPHSPSIPFVPSLRAPRRRRKTMPLSHNQPQKATSSPQRARSTAILLRPRPSQTNL